EVVGGGAKVAAEGGLGIGAQQREIQLAFVVHDDRPIVREHLGDEAQAEDPKEDPQAPVAAPVCAKAQPRTPARRQRHARRPQRDERIAGECRVRAHRALAPNFTRGSTQVYARSVSSFATSPSSENTYSVPSTT